MQPKRFEGCDAPDSNVTTVYIGVDVEDCPCPWEATCQRVRVSGPEYETDISARDLYG